MNAESFKQQFLPLHPKLYRIAFALLENAADAEDILQEGYCKLWSKREELSGILNPEAFCVTLVKNLCLDFLRSPQSGHRTEALEEITQQPGHSSSPLREIEERETLSQVNHLIDRLPDKQRQVIRLRGINDCSLEEIEQITGLSASNVRTLLSRARKMIREQLDKQYKNGQ